MIKSKFTLTVVLAFTFYAFSSGLFAQDQTFSYSYISITGKTFSKKLKVVVDFGDTHEQIKAGEDYSEILTNKKSYAAILNYMVENHFELVETLGLETNSSYQGSGSGGTTGIIFIMKKKNKLDAFRDGLNTSDGAMQGNEGDYGIPRDKGQLNGDSHATSYYGSGTGGYGLNGRSLVGKGKVQQECNEEGRVVVKITVDRNGNVINATPGVGGTTNNHPCLLEPAKKTAFLHKWNLDSKAPNQQIGFLVVNFKLGE